MRFLPKLIKPAISLGKNVLSPLGLSATMSATDTAVEKKMYGSGGITVIFSNKDLEDMTKILKALEDSDVLMEGVSEALKNNTKSKKCGFLSIMTPMLLGTLGRSLIGHLLTGKGMYRAGQGMLLPGSSKNVVVEKECTEQDED